MSAHLYTYQLSYISVLKCASSSLKALFDKIERNGSTSIWPFDLMSRQSVHDKYPSIRFEDQPHDAIKDHFKFAVVRSPISRLLSVYKEKILLMRVLFWRLERKNLKAMGLTKTPDFECFVDNLDAYRKASPMIEGHTQPLSYFLGQDPSWYSEIYNIAELRDRGYSMISQKTNTDIKLPVKNSWGPSRVKVSQTTRNQIQQKFAEDYYLFGHWFDAQASKPQYENRIVN